ncbi:hypothetical protein [Mycobacterium sp.]|uniref:hypothetical protein n=1 Tax=Mycobacterium sp. TaxID=1785 RepID=UPI0025D89A50|nr:hypothetical protein [Mycobacterium sp.]
MSALIIAGEGSFTTAGERLSGPVDAVDKLAKLIEWAHTRRLFSRSTTADGSEDSAPRIWIVGAGCDLLLGPALDGVDAARTEQLGQVLAPLIGQGWDLRPAATRSVILKKMVGGQSISAEIVAERHPWLGGGAGHGTHDVTELGRRLQRWIAAFDVLPGASGAESAATIQDRLMRARDGRRGAVVAEPGILPAHAVPDVRIQPPWCAPVPEVEAELDRSEDLVWLEQECPELAGAGTLTFGHGAPQLLEGDSAARPAHESKRPFGLWRATLPPASSLQAPLMLPPPHPQMSTGDAVQAWVTTEDLAGLTADVRDGGAGLSIDDLTIDSAVVWPQQSRVLEAWATRVRAARKDFADDPAMRWLIDTAAADYLSALADPQPWSDPTCRHHYQPAWAASIAARVRYRGRRAATRIAREYRVWPVYADRAAMIYFPGRDQASNARIDLSDTHSRLGRLMVTRRAELSTELILEILQAQDGVGVATALTQALAVRTPAQNTPQSGAPADGSKPALTAVEPQPEGSAQLADSAAPSTPRERPRAGTNAVRKTRSTAGSAGIPAAVLHTDGLWLPDGTHIQPATAVTHVGQVAELAYAHNIGYHLSATYAEQAQIWITGQACTAFGIDIEAISRRDRTKSLRQLTQGLDFVTLAVAEGWSLGGAGEDPNAQRLGTWTRIYREDTRGEKRGVMVALIPGMDTGADEMPILSDEPSPAQIARRLQLLADALRYPWKINAGVTAVDLMLQTRTKAFSPDEWKNEVFAASTTEVPFGIGDVEADFDWSRPATEEEARCRYLHAYDRGGSYVAGIAGLQLPIGQPVHYSDGAPFDAATPGYWLIDIPEPADWRIPYVLNPRARQFTDAKWVCTPTLERAIDLGYEPRILEAWVWPRHGRVLNGWYERFRDASTTLDVEDIDAQAARNQAKIIRTHGVGVIGSIEHLKGKTAFSPERRFHIVAKAKANIVYRLHQIGQRRGQWPLAVSTDTVLYASNDPDPITAWPGDPKTLGRGFGQYKPEGSALMAEHVEFLNGHDYRGKQHLLDADEWATKLADSDQDRSR